MKYLALALLLLAACKAHSESSSDTHAATHATADAVGQVTRQETTTAPVRIVTDEWLAQNDEPPGLTVTPGIGRALPAGPAIGFPAGHVLRRHQEVTLAPVATAETHADLKSQEREDSDLSAKAEQEKTTDFLHGPFVWIGALVTLAGVAFGIWKLRKAVPL